MTITFDTLDRFQENKVFQAAQTMNNILKLTFTFYIKNHEPFGATDKELPKAGQE